MIVVCIMDAMQILTSNVLIGGPGIDDDRYRSLNRLLKTILKKSQIGPNHKSARHGKTILPRFVILARFVIALYIMDSMDGST